MHISREQTKDGKIVSFDFDEHFEPLYKQKDKENRGVWITAEVINIDTEKKEHIVYLMEGVEFETLQKWKQ